MSNWYHEGAISLVNGSKVVTGAGTAWLDNVAESNGLKTPIGIEEIESVTSNTQLELVMPYAGPSINNVAYSIIPTQGVAVSLVKKVVALLSLSGVVKDAFTNGQLASKIDLEKMASLVDLGADNGSALSGYDGGTLRDIADYAKPMSTYAALRAYAGRAKGVRITTPGVAGRFTRDIADTTTADNGGTVIVDASGRRWFRVFDGPLSVLWFGADRYGINDSTAAFNAALATLASSRISPPGATGWGLGTISVPRGKYLINGEVSCASQLGVRWLGEGEYATTIVRTNDAGNLFKVSTYVGVKFESMTLIHNTGAARSAWSNVAFYLDGTGAGRNLQLKHVTTRGFGTVKKHGKTINEDTNVDDHCTFLDFVTFLDSENPQAVVNTHSNCTWAGPCARVFWVAGQQNTVIISGNIICDGPLVELKNISSKFNDSGFTFINCKLEWTTANTLPGSLPKLIDSVGLFAHMKFRFIDVSLFGGPTPHADARFARITGGGVFDFTGGRISGKLELVGNTAVFVKNGDHIKFENVVLDDPAGWVFTGGASDSFMPISIENCPIGNNNPTSLTILRGPSVPAIAPRRTVVLGKPTTAASYFFAENVPIDLPSYGTRLLVNSIKLVIRNGTSHTTGRRIDVFSDAARTVLIGSLAVVSNPAANTVYEVPVTGSPISEAGFFFTVVNPVATLHAVLVVDFTSV